MDNTSFDVTCIDPPGSVQCVDELPSGPSTGIVLLTYEHCQVHWAWSGMFASDGPLDLMAAKIFIYIRGSIVPSFPGSAQLSVTSVLKAMESWAGPGNEVRFHLLVVSFWPLATVSRG